MSRKKVIQMSFIRAFYGDGRDIDKATAAWAIADYWTAMGNVAMATCFDSIADFYYQKHKKAMDIFMRKLMGKPLTD